jgi:hypothetical protein
VRDALSGVFGRWGKCGAMRVDNGLPLGTPKKETTSPLALWLIGHDVDMIFNKPYCPQANAKVERMQDVSRRWAEAGSARHLAHLQGRLDQEALVQRAWLGVSRMGYLTRLESFPQLETSRRPWRPQDFEPTRVYGFLARKVYVRLVSKVGQIVLFGQRFSVGERHRGKCVHINLDVGQIAWRVFDGQDLVRAIPADHLATDRLMNLTVNVNERTYET